MKAAVFLDRDGVLNEPEPRSGRGQAPLSVAAFRLYPWTADCVARLRAAGCVTILVDGPLERPAHADHRATDLRDAVTIILTRSGGPS